MTERVLGPTGSRRRKRWMLIAPLVVLAVTLVFGVTAAVASHPEESLAGSNFEIDTDANLKQDDASPSIDWASVTQIRKADTASGSTDESFGQGAKEDTAVPSVVDGSIPPNKSDLKNFGLYQEGSTSAGFLNLYWSRVQDPSGTTNMDFEFNKRQCTPNSADADCSGNGITPIRSEGDLLVIYDLAQGGTHPVLSLREWTAAGEWGAPTDLTISSKASGSINTTAIPSTPDAVSDGLGGFGPRTFGEAQLAMSEIFGSTTCESFGSAYLKSRSSDSFTAALKDFIPPVAVDISNCGRVVVKKTAAGGAPLAGAEFTISPASSDTPPDSSLNLVANSSGALFCIDHLLIGTQYTVTESKVPDGYNGEGPKTFTPSGSGSCASVTSSTTPDLTFVNTPKVGAILITKTGKDKSCTGDPLPTGCSAASTRLLANAVFEIFTGANSSTGKIGGDRTTGSDGTVCISGLALGTYTVHEKTAPTGYQKAADQNVPVTEGTCASGAVAANVFDPPLTDVTVSVAPQVTGTTVSKISCDKGTYADNSPNAFDDTSETYTGVATPSTGTGTTTVTCTIVIDP